MNTLQERHLEQVKSCAARNKQDEARALRLLSDVQEMGGTVLDAFRVLNTADRLGQTVDQAWEDWQKTVSTPGFQCPRRAEGGPASDIGVDHWDQDKTCTYCGSMHPDRFMQLIREGAEVEPTDKSYKAYIKAPHPQAGKPVLFSIQSGPAVDSEGKWTREDLTDEEKAAGRFERKEMRDAPATTSAKFYYQHLSQEQRDEFIQLYNDKKMSVGYPGHFYRLPFFCKPLPQE